MENLELYNAFRTPPDSAKKQIAGGRLKGMTDINPMWRIKALTDQFGPCGFGWRYEVTDKCLKEGAGGEVAAFVDIDLYIKQGDSWSAPIPGTGGASFVTNERNGLYTSDECFKMALTDALSVACKALGMAADVYWEKDRTKYDVPQAQTQSPSTPCTDCGKAIHGSKKRDGSPWPASEIVTYSQGRFSRPLCPDCQRKAFQAEKEAAGEGA